jgi:hypothetical protein
MGSTCEPYEGKIGKNETEINSMSRAQMMELYAEAICKSYEGVEEDVAAAAPAVEERSIYVLDPEVEKMKLEFEREKWAAEVELKKMEMAANKERADAEIELKRMELRLKSKEEEREEEFTKARLDEMRRNQEKEKSLMARSKQFSDAMRGLFAKMPQEALELVPYFKNVEQLFDNFSVDANLRVHLLRPHLTEAARVLVARMDSSDALDYAKVKAMLLHEFKLSPAMLLDRFNSLARNNDETYTLFANRLKSVLSYYTECREVDTYAALLDLLVCDRVKSGLSEGALRYVLSIESKVKGNWLPLSELTETLDLFYDSHVSGDKPRYVNNAMSNAGPVSRFANNNKIPPARPPPPPNAYFKSQNNASAGRGLGGNKRCFVCNSPNHLQNYHSKVGNRPVGQGANNNFISKSEPAAIRRVNVNVVNAVDDVGLLSDPIAQSRPMNGVDNAVSGGHEMVPYSTMPAVPPRPMLNSMPDRVRTGCNVNEDCETRMKAFVCDLAVTDVCNSDIVILTRLCRIMMGSRW